MYDRRVLRVEPPALPVLSIGNMTVGGTGKTPVAAWAAAALVARGAKPAIVLRGYGDDEPRVHARLNPGVPVITMPARAVGVRKARDQGCDVAVLDDAFQHRRIGRDQDWVLISADRWTDRRHLLPAGPWREPLSALRRATIAVVTRKAVSRERAREVLARLGGDTRRTPAAIMHLEPDRLRGVHGDESLTLDSIAGAQVFLIAGIGDPGALRRQLEEHGARVRTQPFADHHAYTPSEIGELAGSAKPDEIVVCTLKDAVKIGGEWPRAGPALWYVSQRVTVEEGGELLSGSLEALLRRRPLDTDAARSRGPYP
jgi:tetraacyldisaccharide 4'-kinase